MGRLLSFVLGCAVVLSACGSSNAAATNANPVTPATQASPAASAPAGETTTETPTETAGASGIDDAGWFALAPDGAGFTAKFPGTPKQTSQTYKTDVGDAPSSLWSWQQSSDLSYFVVTATYPKGSLSSVDPGLVYDAAIDGMTGGAAALAVANETDMTMNGHPGQVFSLAGTTANIEGQIVLAGDNLYVVYVLFSPTVTDFSGVDAFFADFTLTA
jgi:hypothetical protein